MESPDWLSLVLCQPQPQTFPPSHVVSLLELHAFGTSSTFLYEFFYISAHNRTTMTPTNSQPRYEHTVAEDTVLALHQLCRTCQDFVHRSGLLKKMSRGSEIKFSTSETTPLCSVDQLQAGYLGGCHFCALVWHRAGGHLLCSTKMSLASCNMIEVQLTARNWEIERRMWDGPQSLRVRWWKVVPPAM